MKLDKSVFSLHKGIRERFVQYLEGFTLEQLAVIPQGFRNNLLWNISHAIVTQQLYCYYNSGLPMYVPEDFIAAYRKGTVPDGHVPTQEEVDKALEALKEAEKKVYKKSIKDILGGFVGKEAKKENTFNVDEDFGKVSKSNSLLAKTGLDNNATAYAGIALTVYVKRRKQK